MTESLSIRGRRIEPFYKVIFFSKAAPPTILTVDPDGRNSYEIEHYQILFVSIVISIFNQGTASIKSFTSLANIIKTKCGIGEKDAIIKEISTFEFLFLIFFLIISQIFRTFSLILLYSTMEFFAIIPIVFIFVNNIILLGQRLYGKQILKLNLVFNKGF